MRDEILQLLEKNSRLTTTELSVMLGFDESDVQAELAQMQAERVICGYHTLINWDKTNKEFVTALIEVKVTPTRGLGFDKIAERIYNFEEVKAVYLMSGGFDLTVIVEGKTIKDVAYFVSNRLSVLESVLSTATHFVLKKYKDHGIILENDNRIDGRMIISS